VVLVAAAAIFCWGRSSWRSFSLPFLTCDPLGTRGTASFTERLYGQHRPYGAAVFAGCRSHYSAAAAAACGRLDFFLFFFHALTVVSFSSGHEGRTCGAQHPLSLATLWLSSDRGVCDHCSDHDLRLHPELWSERKNKNPQELIFFLILQGFYAMKAQPQLESLDTVLNACIAFVLMVVGFQVIFHSALPARKRMEGEGRGTREKIKMRGRGETLEFFFCVCVVTSAFRHVPSLVVTSFWCLGFNGTFLGDDFGILMPARVTVYPFNVLSDPLNFFSLPTKKASQAERNKEWCRS
jgi:hypothetical protein